MFSRRKSLQAVQGQATCRKIPRLALAGEAASLQALPVVKK